MKINSISMTALLVLAVQNVQAADPTVITITATRTNQKVDNALSSVTVITRHDIERLQANSIRDLIAGLPGINIDNNGGPGKTTSIFMRGTESDHILVMIDGVKVGSATTGTTAFQDIPVDQIERIEIVRGPRSSLYGSEAIGGVIQIFTRKGGGALKPSFSIGAGSYSTYTATAGVSGGGEHSWYSLNTSGTDTKGFNACTGKPSPGGAGCYTIEPDKDGYRNFSGSFRAGYRFDNNVSMDAHAMKTKSHNNYDGSTVNESNAAQEILGGTLHFSPLAPWQATLSLGSSRDDSDNFKNGVFKTRYNTKRDNVSFQNDINITDKHLLTLGADYQKDHVDSTTNYTISSRHNTGLFTQYQGTFNKQELQFSMRQDDNEQFGRHYTGAAAWGTSIDKDLRATFSYGTAFKAPTFNELYYPGYGNENLQPEQSRSIEVGLKGKRSQSDWSINLYETRIDNLIAYDSSISKPGNIDLTRIRGLELVFATIFHSWTINSNLTLLDPINQSAGSNHGNLLPRRSGQTVRLDIDRPFKKYRLGATLRAEGRRYDDVANTRVLAGYALLDLRAEYQLTKAWQLQGRIENLFNKVYETSSFYNQPGRSLFVTLRYQP